MEALSRAIDRLRNASQRGEPLTIRGSGSRRIAWTDERHELCSREFDAVEAIDADERIATVGAGVALESLHSLLAEKQLMFPAAHPGPALRQLGFPGFAHGTIGGLYSDPREAPTFPKNGRVRDHVLGIEAIRGDGTPFKAGGRVVKNVTGYDLTRLLCGARGRLGLVTRLHLRLDSLPECSLMAIVEYSTHSELFDALAALRVTGREPLILAILPSASDESHRLLIGDSGRRSVAYLQLGRLLERLSRQPEGGILEVTEDDDGELPWTTKATTAVRVRVRLPFRRWCGFIRALPLTRLAVEWETIFPFAHFGLARLTSEVADRRRANLDGLVRLAKVHGGSVVLEDRPKGWDPGHDPLAEGSPASDTLLRRLGTAWDPAGVLWRWSGADR